MDLEYEVAVQPEKKKRGYFGIAFFAIIMMLAFFTNIKESQYKTEVYSKLTSDLKAEVDDDPLAMVFAGFFVENMVQVNVHDYLFFSTASAKIGGENPREKTISYSVFGKVFFLDFDLRPNKEDNTD